MWAYLKGIIFGRVNPGLFGLDLIEVGVIDLDLGGGFLMADVVQVIGEFFLIFDELTISIGGYVFGGNIFLHPSILL